MDGTYRLSADPQCGEFTMDGSSLVVRGGKATLTPGLWAGSDNRGQPASGTVTITGKNVRIHVANGTATVIDLTATIGASGPLSGSGQSGGVHLLLVDACPGGFGDRPGPHAGRLEDDQPSASKGSLDVPLPVHRREVPLLGGG